MLDAIKKAIKRKHDMDNDEDMPEAKRIKLG